MTTDVAISPGHNVWRLAGTLTHLDSGAGNAGIAIYPAPRPAPGAAAGAAPLVTIALAKPAGVLTNVLTLTPATAEGKMVLASGTAAWARFFNGAGEWVMDCDVSDEAGTATVKMPTTTLYAGGRCPLISSTLS